MGGDSGGFFPPPPIKCTATPSDAQLPHLAWRTPHWERKVWPCEGRSPSPSQGRGFSGVTGCIGCSLVIKGVCSNTCPSIFSSQSNIIRVACMMPYWRVRQCDRLNYTATNSQTLVCVPARVWNENNNDNSNLIILYLERDAGTNNSGPCEQPPQPCLDARRRDSETDRHSYYDSTALAGARDDVIKVSWPVVRRSSAANVVYTRWVTVTVNYVWIIHCVAADFWHRRRKYENNKWSCL